MLGDCVKNGSVALRLFIKKLSFKFNELRTKKTLNATEQRFVFRQGIHIVEHIYKQKLFCQCFGEAMFHPTIVLSISKRKFTVSFMVINPCRVIKWSRAESKGVIGRREKIKKSSSRKNAAINS
jgi:hypothetical protein